MIREDAQACFLRLPVRVGNILNQEAAPTHEDGPVTFGGNISPVQAMRLTETFAKYIKSRRTNRKHAYMETLKAAQLNRPAATKCSGLPFIGRAQPAQTSLLSMPIQFSWETSSITLTTQGQCRAGQTTGGPWTFIGYQDRQQVSTGPELA